MKNLTKIRFFGVRQVMLQKNAGTSLLILASVFYNSWIMGLGAVGGCFRLMNSL
jgi:urea transporter